MWMRYHFATCTEQGTALGWGAGAQRGTSDLGSHHLPPFLLLQRGHQLHCISIQNSIPSSNTKALFASPPVCCVDPISFPMQLPTVLCNLLRLSTSHTVICALHILKSFSIPCLLVYTISLVHNQWVVIMSQVKQNPEPKLISSVRSRDMWNRVALRVVLATGALGTTVLYDLRIKIHLIISGELWSILFPALLSHLSICYTVDMCLNS